MMKNTLSQDHESLYNHFMRIYERELKTASDQMPSSRIVAIIASALGPSGIKEIEVAASFPSFLGAPEFLPEDIYSIRLFMEPSSLDLSKMDSNSRAPGSGILFDDPLVFHKEHIVGSILEIKKSLLSFELEERDALDFSCLCLTALIIHTEHMRDNLRQSWTNHLVGKLDGKPVDAVVSFKASASWTERSFMDNDMGVKICEYIDDYCEKLEKSGEYSQEALKSIMTASRPLSSLQPWLFEQTGPLFTLATNLDVNPHVAEDAEIYDQVRELFSAVKKNMSVAPRRYRH